MILSFIFIETFYLRSYTYLYFVYFGGPSFDATSKGAEGTDGVLRQRTVVDLDSGARWRARRVEGGGESG